MEELLANRKELQETLRGIGSCDLVVGVPTFHHVKNVGPLVQALVVGLRKAFPEAKAVLVNSDGGSIDGTVQAVAEAAAGESMIQLSHRVHPGHKIRPPFHGLPGRENAYRMILTITKTLGAKACAMVDPDHRDLSPEWVDGLLRPVLHGDYDYVVPYYFRHKYDGTITSSIIYPLLRALYGKQIRQPIGGDCALKGELAGSLLERIEWESDLARYAVDLWMTLEAILKGRRMCQAYLGVKSHATRVAGVDLSTMLVQLVGSVFGLMEKHADAWKAVGGSEPVPRVGIQHEVVLEPVPVNVDRMLKAFALGVNEFIPLWDGVLSEEILLGLKDLQSSTSKLDFPDALWTRILYDFALGSHRQTMARDHLLKSLTPLYLGRVASFIQETQQTGPKEAEERIEALCKAFEQDKPYLTDRWDALEHHVEEPS